MKYGLLFFRVVAGCVVGGLLIAAIVAPGMLVAALVIGSLWLFVERRERRIDCEGYSPAQRPSGRWDAAKKLGLGFGLPALLIVVVQITSDPQSEQPSSRAADQSKPQPPPYDPFVASHGREPQPSAWDGNYREVRDYLRRVAHDPSKVSVERCTKVVRSEAGWLTRCMWRGSNAFGAIVAAEHTFIISNGTVQVLDP